VIVSNLFKQKIYATERSIQAKVSFEILDVKAYEDATYSVTGEAEISRLGQTINKIRDMSNKYATFEKDYFRLDGSFHLPPRENESDSELGWWSDILSGEDGTFAVRPAMTFAFGESHSSIGLTITFDRQTNEYATDFLVEVTGPTGTIASEFISGNTNPVYYFQRPIEGYTRVVITIVKWVNPNRRARITEVDFGAVQEYTGDKLISLKVLEEMDLLASTVPSNEMQFVLDNSDQYFNILNPSGVYRFIVPNQEMSAEIGLLIGENKYEWISMGRYYLTDWTVEEGAMTSTFVGRDIFTKLELVDYTRLLQNTNLHALALDILDEANITDYEIDEALKTITTVGFKEKIKVREALQMIAIAGKAVVRQGRDGSVVLEQYEELKFETGYITWTGLASGETATTGEFASTTTYPQVYVDYTFQQIDFDNAYEIPRITLGQNVTHLVFKVTPATGEQFDVKVINSAIKEGIGYEINNPLINTEVHALDISEWMFQYYNMIADYQANWRQNPALECGNIILIEDRFGNKKKARITKNEFNYAGYLSGITNAKGGV
jgi:hypothetical protein